MKKLFAWMLALCMALGMTAMSGAAAEGDEIIVGYIAKNTVDVFHAPLNRAAGEALDALKADGTIAGWHLFDGLTDPMTQNNLLEDALNMGCNVIIMLPAEAAGCAPMLERCKEANVPVIVVNSMTTNTAELATSYVGSNDVQAGEMMAEFVIAQLPDGGGFGHIQGVIGNSAQIQRGEGLHNIMGPNEKWRLLDGCEQTGEWQAEKAVKFAEDWLTKYGDELNAIICDNDDMSSAVQGAMNAAGRSDIVCIGVDGNAGPLAMVKSGELLATVFQDGVGQVTTAIGLIKDIKEGKEVEKNVVVPFVLVTSENVDDFI